MGNRCPRRADNSDPTAPTISVGVGRACCVSRDRSVVCWLGDWPDGELEACQIQYQQISAGEERACGVSDDGRLICQSWSDVWQAGEPGSVTGEWMSERMAGRAVRAPSALTARPGATKMAIGVGRYLKADTRASACSANTLL